jgi:hypothetical protein
MSKRTLIIAALAILFFIAALVSLLIEKQALQKIIDGDPEPEPKEDPVNNPFIAKEPIINNSPGNEKQND